MVVGFMKVSPSDMAGSSTGKPPACKHAALHLLGTHP